VPTAPEPPRFRERPTELVVRDAWVLGLAPLAGAGLAGAAGQLGAGAALLVLALCVAAFFRNPPRAIPGGERDAVAPADGRVLEAGEVELPDGRKAVRVGIFLSIFDVHVNRSPVSGRVISIRRGGRRFLAAFDPRAREENAQLAMELETADGARVTVVQITGLVARRIVCHPVAGEWVSRGARYGLIRFGSRTDVLLPPGSELCVAAGDRVKGGRSAIARLPGPDPAGAGA